MTQLTLVANALCGYHVSTIKALQKKGDTTNIMKGIIAIATHPLLVAKGALCPMFMFGHWYGCFEKRRARHTLEWEIGRERREACSPAKKVIIPATVMTAASGGEYQPKALTRNWRAVAYRQNAAIRSIVLG